MWDSQIDYVQKSQNGYTSCVNADECPLYEFGACNFLFFFFFFFLRGCNFLFDSLIFQSSGFQTLVKVLGF